MPTKNYIQKSSLFRPSFTDGVEFFSRFENGNLKKAIRISRVEYQLLLDEDFNTKGHYHWFYFKTKSNLPAGTQVTFKILNLIKPESLYPLGFKPFNNSIKENKGWVNNSTNIKYYKNTISREGGIGEENTFYTLEWNFIYEFADDEVYFSQFPPYSYSDLLKYIQTIKEQNNGNNIIRIDGLCKTLAKNICPVITITENVDTYLPYEYELVLASKSLASRRMYFNRVSKLRAQIERKRRAKKIKKLWRKTQTKDDVLEPTQFEEEDMSTELPKEKYMERTFHYKYINI